MLVKVGSYYLPIDFIVLEMDENPIYPIILGRPFLATARALIDVERGELVLRIHDEQLTFNVFNLSQEADHEDNKLMEEPNKEVQTTHLEASLVGKPYSKEELCSRMIQGEPEPSESCKINNKNPLEKESIESKRA